MKLVPPNAERFLGASGTSALPGRPALLGIPYDGTTSFRPGTRFGPDGIRQVSDGLESYSPALDRDLVDFPFTDLGNLDLPVGDPARVGETVHDTVAELLEAEAIPFLLGGEHSLTPGAVRAVHQRYPDLTVLQFDAHADLRDSFQGCRWSHACAMRRILDFLPAERLTQVGIRSGTREEYESMRATGNPHPVEDWEPGEDDRGPVYLTFDLDLFDPACLPGTGTPEPGGISWADFAALLPRLPMDRVVGLDVVELSPPLDPGGASSLLAAKVVRELLLVLNP